MKRILLPVDFSPFGLHALRYGCALARQNEAELFLLHVIQNAAPTSFAGEGIVPVTAADYLEQLESSAQEALAEVLPHAWTRGLKVRRLTVIGAPWTRIVEFSTSQGIDLICLGTHGRGGFSRMMLGSVAEKVIQHAPCKVLVVRRHGPEPIDDDRSELAIERVLVPVDFGDTTRSALEEGFALARDFRAELHLVHVVENASLGASEISMASPVLQSYMHELVEMGQKQLEKLYLPAGQPAVPIQRKVVTGRPVDMINDYAEEHDIDLIVMGTHGRTGPSHWLLGSVAERVVRSAPCPVLVMPRHPPTTKSFPPPEAALAAV